MGVGQFNEPFLNFNREINDMGLKFGWVARFCDGSELRQFEDLKNQSVEAGFKQVLDRQDELAAFELVSACDGARFSVDLNRGLISAGDGSGSAFNAPAEEQLREAYKYRLIYFRRVTRNFNQNLQQIGEAGVVYFLGFQYVDENGKNHKRIMSIDGNGRFVTN